MLERGTKLREFIEGKKGACPLVRRPFRACYHINLYAPRVKEVMYYCSKNYTQCGIYRKEEGLGKS